MSFFLDEKERGSFLEKNKKTILFLNQLCIDFFLEEKVAKIQDLPACTRRQVLLRLRIECRPRHPQKRIGAALFLV